MLPEIGVFGESRGANQTDSCQFQGVHRPTSLPGSSTNPPTLLRDGQRSRCGIQWSWSTCRVPSPPVTSSPLATVGAPARTDVGPYLHDAWECLGAKQRREVCAHETLAEAIVDVLRRVYDAPAHCVNEGRSWKGVVYLGEGRWASHTWVDTASRASVDRWATATYERGGEHSPDWTRDIQVSARLRLFHRAEATLTQSMARPLADTREWRLLTRLTVRLWWAARIAEGYPPETAQMMLGLIVPIEALQHLDFPTDIEGRILHP